MSPDSTCRALCIPPRMLWRLVHSGELRAVRIMVNDRGPYTIITEASVQAYIERNRLTPAKRAAS